MNEGGAPPAGERPVVRAVFFDLDGTLTEHHLDFAEIRRRIGVPDGLGIIEHLDGLPAAVAAEKLREVEDWEAEAAAASRLRPGAREAIEELRAAGVAVGVITRNSRRSYETFCERHGLAFDVAVTREDGPAKPSPEPVLRAAAELGLDPSETVMVGDYLYDVRSGRLAGAWTVLLTDGRVRGFESESTFTAGDMSIVRRIFRNRFDLRGTRGQSGP